jgi:hypothetical protein
MPKTALHVLALIIALLLLVQAYGGRGEEVALGAGFVLGRVVHE